MAKAKDLAGKRFGRLKCIKIAKKRFKGERIRWVCECSCGNSVEIFSENLLSGNTKSCGCLSHERIASHGMSNSRIYQLWSQMKQRCNNENNLHYKNYGGRGIKLCDDWISFKSFYDWAILNGYGDRLTIERLDNDKGYSSDNCTFVTKSEQSKNRRVNYRVNINGSVMCLYDACKHLNIDYSLVQNRIKNLNWPVDKALYTPRKKKTRCNSTVIKYKGMSLNIREWADYLHLSYKSLYGQLYRYKVKNGLKAISAECLEAVIKIQELTGTPTYAKGVI